MTGVSRLVGELVRRLPERGYSPVVAARRLPVEPLEGCRVERVGMLSLTSRLRAASFDWAARRCLVRARVRFVHGHGDLTRQDLLSVHNCDAAAARWVPGGRESSAGVLYVRRRQFKNCGFVLAVSDMVRRDLTKYYSVPPEKIQTVYPGVDLDRFHPRLRPEARESLRKAAGWSPETRVVLSVLSGDPDKRNFSLITRAVEIFSDRRPAALCLVGNVRWEGDPAARRLKARGRLHHVPATPRVEKYFAAADAFLLPAHYEEFGMTVLEAMASGCPVVVSARSGASELVRPGENGFILWELRDPGEAVDALDRLSSLSGAGTIARRTAELYSWDRHADEIVRIYSRWT